VLIHQGFFLSQVSRTMASQHTPVTPEISDYLDQMFSVEDDVLRQVKVESLAHGLPEINIGGVQAGVLQFILKLMNAKRVLEIGSLGGYSAISMAQALGEGSQVVCLEKNEQYAEVIKSNIRMAKMDSKIQVITGKALDALKQMQQHNTPLFDFVFIDADKQNYVNYLNESIPLLREGGVVCGDNTSAWGCIANVSNSNEPQNVVALQAFNKAMKLHPSLFCIMLPVGDGMTLGIKQLK
jgi:caffeoyl-CoA O-methyltransferase